MFYVYCIFVLIILLYVVSMYVFYFTIQKFLKWHAPIQFGFRKSTNLVSSLIKLIDNRNRRITADPVSGYIKQNLRLFNSVRNTIFVDTISPVTNLFESSLMAIRDTFGVEVLKVVVDVGLFVYLFICLVLFCALIVGYVKFLISFFNVMARLLVNNHLWNVFEAFVFIVKRALRPLYRYNVVEFECESRQYHRDTKKYKQKNKNCDSDCAVFNKARKPKVNKNKVVLFKELEITVGTNYINSLAQPQVSEKDGTIKGHLDNLTIDEQRRLQYCPAPTWRGQTGKVFENNVYKKISLPKWFESITYESIPDLIGSLVALNETNFATPVLAKAYVEFKRKLAMVRETWATEEGDENLKEFILELYLRVPNVQLRSDNSYLTPEHHTYQYDVKICMPDFKDEHFSPIESRKGKASEPFIKRDGNPNFVYDLIDRCNVKSKQLPLNKFKSLIKTMKQSGKSLDQVLEVLADKCYIWKAKDEEPDFRRLSWIVPYVKPEILYYEISSRSKFWTIFKSHILSLRNSMFKFARSYYDYAELSHVDRKDLRKVRIELFRDYMRGPQAQQKFLMGVPRETIEQDIYATKINTIDARMKRNEIFKDRLATRTVNREKRTSRLRDEKTFVQNYFEPESLVTYRMTFNTGCVVLVCVIGYLGYIFSTKAFEKIKNKYRDAKNMVLDYDAKLSEAFQLARKANNIHDKTTECINGYSKFFSAPSFEFINSDHKLLAMDIKTLLHCLFHVHQGNYSEAMAWASNFGVTRPEHIFKAISSLNFSHLKLAISATTTVFVYKGVRYVTNPEGYNKILRIFDSKLDPDKYISDMSEASFETQSNEYADIFTTICGLFTKNTTSHLSPQDIRELNAQFTYVNNVKREASDKAKVIMNIISVLMRTFYAFDPFDAMYQRFAGDMMGIVASVNELMLNKHDLAANKSKMTMVLDVHKAACTLNVHPRMQSIPSFFRSIYMKRFTDLEELAKYCSGILHGTADRMEPLCVLFTGPPNVGKSAVMKFLTKSISQLDGEICEPQNVYTFSGESEYWEGYAQQKYVMVDDVFKQVDSTVRATEAASFIGMVNTAAYPLNMAFQEKGTAFFRSDYVMASTNIANEGYENCSFNVGLTDPKALLRRFHLIFHREQKIEKDVADNTYIVSRCQLFPNLERKVLTAPQVALLMKKHKATQDMLHKQHDYSPERLDQIFKDVSIDQLLDEPPLAKTVAKKQVGKPLITEIKSSNVATDDNFKTESNLEISDALLQEFIRGQREEQAVEPTDYFDRFVQYIGEFNNDENFVTYLAAGFFTVVAFATIGHFGYKYLFDTSLESWKRKGKTGKGKKTDVSIPRNIRLKRVARFSAESNIDNYILQNMKVNKGVVYLDAITADGYAQSGVGFHIKDGIIATTAHFYRSFDHYSDVTLTITWDGGEVTYPMPSDIIPVEGIDMVFFDLPPKVNRPPSVYKYLIKKENIYSMTDGQTLKLLSADEHGKGIIRDTKKIPNTDPFEYSSAGQKFVVDVPLSYYGTSVKGDSGALITVEGPQGQAWIVGMHVGKKAGKGIAIPLCMEYIDSALFSTEATGMRRVPVEVAYTVPPEKAHRTSSISKIKKSCMFAWDGPPECVPVHLSEFENSSGEIVDPMFEAMKKMNQQERNVEETPDYIIDHIGNLYPPPDEVPVLPTWDQVINGDADLGYTSICFSTSPGYPYSLNATKGKAPYIYQGEDGRHYLEPTFEKELNEYEEKLRSGQQIEVLWADCLKDETRPLKKVDAGKTRLFSSCPLHFMLIMRKYTIHYLTYVQSKCSTHPISVGINPSSTDWAMIYNKLVKALSHVAGDCGNYDASISKQVGQGNLKIMNNYYKDGFINMRVRELLFEHIYNSWHIWLDIVYKCALGNPSGNSITSWYNSAGLLQMLYNILINDLGFSFSEIELVVYGDDSLIGLKRLGVRASDLAPHFLRRYGVVFTHGSKEESIAHDTMETVTYLSRKFRCDMSVVRAPLPIKTIVESTYWVRTSSNAESVMLQTAENLFLELSHHDKDTFEAVSRQFLRAVKERRPELYEYILSKKKSYYAYFQDMYTHVIPYR